MSDDTNIETTTTTQPAANVNEQPDGDSYAAHRAARLGDATEAPAESTTAQTPEEIEAAAAAASKPQVPERKPAPYRNAVPPQRVEAMLGSAQRRQIELETENRMLRERVGNVQPEQQTQHAPEPMAKPLPAQFIDEETGKFNADAYTDALTAYATEQALAKVTSTLTERDQVKQQEQEHARFVQHVNEVHANFAQQKNELIADPEIGEDAKVALDWITSDEVARHMHPRTQVTLMRAGAEVAYLAAQDQRIIDVLCSNDVQSAAEIITRLDTFVRMQAPVEQTPAPQTQQAPRVPQIPARTGTGQFAPRTQPAGPADTGAGAGGSGGSAYETHRARRLAAARAEGRPY